MGLIGARMAVVTEMTDDNSIKLDVGVIKAITGQDTLSYRQIYSTQTEFTPTCKLMMSCNTIPRFAADGGMSRRFEALPFERAFREVPMPDDPVDPHRPAFDPALRAKLIAAKDAIFTHLVFRAKALYDAGFKINAPHRVTDFSSATLDDMNPLRNFVDECCLRCDEFVTNAELRDSFSTWATRNRVQGASWSQHKLTTEMKRLSFQEARKTSARGFTGLRIQKHLLPQSSPF
jgi:phage/plasmid-associated DNA primase